MPRLPPSMRRIEMPRAPPRTPRRRARAQRRHRPSDRRHLRTLRQTLHPHRPARRRPPHPTRTRRHRPHLELPSRARLMQRTQRRTTRRRGGDAVTECPICGGRMPAPKSTGRPRQFCCTVCRKRADRRRSQAARILEFAELLVRNAAKEQHGPATPEQLARRLASRQRRIDRLRDDAATLLEGIGPGPAS